MASRKNRICLITAILLSLFAVGGACLEFAQKRANELRTAGGLLLASAAFLVCVIALDLLLRPVFSALDAMERKDLLRTKGEEPTFFYGRWLRKRPFLTSFLTLLVLYLPYIVISYPGIFMGDVEKTLIQGMGGAAFTSHQPPLYTLFFTGLIRLGHVLLPSWNGSAMMASMLQMLFLFAVIAEGNRLLIRGGLRWEAALGYLAYYCLSLVVSNYMMLLTKDVWYVAFFFLWIQGLTGLLTERPGKNGIRMTIGMLGMLCFRNEAILVLLLSFLLCAASDRGHRKTLLGFTAGAAAVYAALLFVIYPGIGVSSGLDGSSRRDLMSISFQQTGRTVLYHQDELSEEEKTTILNAFSFESLDELAAEYSPEGPDYIKIRFTEDADSKEAEAYFRTWRELGKKYPGCYLLAWAENYYQYFYPKTPFWVYTYDWSAECMGYVNGSLKTTDFHHPESLARARSAYESIRRAAYRFTPLLVFNGAGVVSWIMIIWTAWVIYRKKKNLIPLLIPAWVVLFNCLFSPCNGYYGRYQYPIFVTLPWTLLVGSL